MGDINTRKITQTDIAVNGVQSMPDRPTGTPAENKARFDKLIQNVVMPKLNGLIDDLLKRTGGTSGADNIGVRGIAGLTPTGGTGGSSGSLYQMLDALKNAVAEATLGAIADRSITEIKFAIGAVLSTVLAGYVISEEDTPLIEDTDTLLEALGKITKLINNKVNTETGKTLADIRFYDDLTLASDNWVGADPYTKEVTVAGILSTDNPIVDLDLSTTDFANVEDHLEDWSYIYKIVATNDTLTFYATEQISNDLKFIVKVVE